MIEDLQFSYTTLPGKQIGPRGRIVTVPPSTLYVRVRWQPGALFCFETPRRADLEPHPLGRPFDFEEGHAVLRRGDEFWSFGAREKSYTTRTGVPAVPADWLRAKLTGFEPTEAEFRALFRLEREFDQQFQPTPEYPNADPGRQQRMGEALLDLDRQVRSALGEECYQDYQHAQDPAYRSLVELARRYEVSKATVLQIYGMKQNAEAQIAEVGQNAGANPEEAAAIIQATGQQTVAAMRALLGEKAFADYTHRGGYWLTRLGR